MRLEQSIGALADAVNGDATSVDPAVGLFDVAKTFVTKKPTGGTVLVPVDELQVEHDYQRPPDRDKIREFVRHRRSGGQLPAIKVNMRPDGSLWITDGQHRAAAAAICGDDTVDAHVTHVPQHREAEETSILTKIAADADHDAIGRLLAAGARRHGKQLRVELGRAGTVTYTPHGGEWVAKQERGQLTVDARKARDVLDRLDLADLCLENGGLRPAARHLAA